MDVPLITFSHTNRLAAISEQPYTLLPPENSSEMRKKERKRIGSKKQYTGEEKKLYFLF
jgi:hypothetical protein